jgi:hypothetical protein
MDHEGGGWTQIADFHAGADADECPAAWEQNEDPAFCYLADTPGDGTDVPYRSLQGDYREVRGYLRGYQYNSADGFHNDATIDEAYVEGVSITRGHSPRTHVWTYAAGLWQGSCFQCCPCPGGNAPPDFVGPSYYCDSGNDTASWFRGWRFDFPLWDADGTDADCALTSAPAWFVVDLRSTSSDPIDLRILMEGGDENIGITEVVLFVR